MIISEKVNLHILENGVYIQTSVSNSPDSTSMFMSVIIFTRSTNNPGRSAVSTYNKLQNGRQVSDHIHVLLMQKLALKMLSKTSTSLKV